MSEQYETAYTPEAPGSTLGEARESVGLQPAVFNTVVPIAETKPGWQTTEFWVAVLTLIAVNLNGVVLTLPDKYQVIATAIVAGLYAVARGLAKQGVPVVESPAPEA